MQRCFTDLSKNQVWRPFGHLNQTEALFLAKCCGNKDLSNYEVTCYPGTTSFCAIQHTTAATWRWAVFNASGEVLDVGTENNRSEAIRAAIEAQPLWHHRCTAKGVCRCHNGVDAPTKPVE